MLQRIQKEKTSFMKIGSNECKKASEFSSNVPVSREKNLLASTEHLVIKQPYQKFKNSET